MWNTQALSYVCTDMRVVQSYCTKWVRIIFSGVRSCSFKPVAAFSLAHAIHLLILGAWVLLINLNSKHKPPIVQHYPTRVSSDDQVPISPAILLLRYWWGGVRRLHCSPGIVHEPTELELLLPAKWAVHIGACLKHESHRAVEFCQVMCFLFFFFFLIYFFYYAKMGNAQTSKTCLKNFTILEFFLYLSHHIFMVIDASIVVFLSFVPFNFNGL